MICVKVFQTAMRSECFVLVFFGCFIPENWLKLDWEKVLSSQRFGSSITSLWSVCVRTLTICTYEHDVTRAQPSWDIMANGDRFTVRFALYDELLF